MSIKWGTPGPGLTKEFVLLNSIARRKLGGALKFNHYTW